MQKHRRIFFGYAKKSRDFFGKTNSEVGIFLGLNYEPQLDPTVIKICEWGPWGRIRILQDTNKYFMTT